MLPWREENGEHTGDMAAASGAGRLRVVSERLRRRPLPEELDGWVVRGAELVLQRRRERRETPLPAGLGALNAVLEGGLARGAVTELVGARSCGRMTAVLAALAEVTGRGEIAALVDLGDQLDAEGAREAGVDLERLLWLRPRRLPGALEMTELTLQAGFPLVVIDLGLPPVRGRVSPGAWMRIAREAAARGGTVLLSSPYPVAGHTTTAIARFFRGRGAWSGRPGVSALLEGLHLGCTILRRRGGRPGQRAAELLRSSRIGTAGTLQTKTENGDEAAACAASTGDCIHEHPPGVVAIRTVPVHAPRRATRLAG
ncbi:MAG: hypothetical protein GXP48_03945 [Acidobacteria bacterium]|nr:hypothetical protein [Acidobacteriota bacterium]